MRIQVREIAEPDASAHCAEITARPRLPSACDGEAAPGEFEGSRSSRTKNHAHRTGGQALRKIPRRSADRSPGPVRGACERGPWATRRIGRSPSAVHGACSRGTLVAVCARRSVICSGSRYRSSSLRSGPGSRSIWPPLSATPEASERRYGRPRRRANYAPQWARLRRADQTGRSRSTTPGAHSTRRCSRRFWRRLPAAISFHMGVPAERIAEAHDVGARWIQQVGDVRSAELALEAGADVLVAQGSEAGGNAGWVATMVLVPQVVDVAGDVPVLAAGGVGDGRGLAAALTLGAQGVMVGRGFSPAPRCDRSAVEGPDPCLRRDRRGESAQQRAGDAAVHHRSAPGRAAGAAGAPYAARRSARSRAGIRGFDEARSAAGRGSPSQPWPRSDALYRPVGRAGTRHRTGRRDRLAPRSRSRGRPDRGECVARGTPERRDRLRPAGGRMRQDRGCTACSAIACGSEASRGRTLEEAATHFERDSTDPHGSCKVEGGPGDPGREGLLSRSPRESVSGASSLRRLRVRRPRRTPRTLGSTKRPNRVVEPFRLEELVLAGEDRRDRLVREDVADRLGEDPRHGQHLQLGRLLERVDRDRVGDDDLARSRCRRASAARRPGRARASRRRRPPSRPASLQRLRPGEERRRRSRSCRRS